MACPSSHRCGYGCCSVRATTSHHKRGTQECCSSQSWFCINRRKDLLVDLSELIEVYLIYAHPNFHTYSYFIQFNIHLFLKSIQKLKLQNVATGNREYIPFQIRKYPQLTSTSKPARPGPNKKQSKQTHTHKPEIAAMKARNFQHDCRVARRSTYIHTHKPEIAATKTRNFPTTCCIIQVRTEITVRIWKPAHLAQTKAHTRSEIAAMKMRNFLTVGGHFSCMKKRQNTSFSKENSELTLAIVQLLHCRHPW